MSERDHRGLLDELERLGNEYAAILAGLPDAALQRRAGAEEWTLAEQTGHVAEFPVTFARHAQRAAEQPGSPVGRHLDDHGRLEAVARLTDVKAAEAAEAVRSGIRQALEILCALPEDAWDKTGVSARQGEMKVRDIVRLFIVEHLRGHIEQAKATVAAGQRDAI